MALEEIASTGDTLALAKTNAAIRAAKELQTGLADATSLLAETTALHIEPSTRPGEARLLFTSALTGAGKDINPIDVGVSVLGLDGIVLRAAQVAPDPLVVAVRADQPTEAGVTYAARIAVRRFKNTSDPLGDTVQFGIACLNAAKQKVSERIFFEGAVVVADGLISRQVTFSRDQEAELALSDTTRYVRPFVRIFGGDGITDVAVVGSCETNGLPGTKGDQGPYPEYVLNEESEEIQWRQGDGALGPVLDIGSARKKAEAAKDIAAGYASDMSTRSDTVPIYGTTLGMTALNLPAGLNAFRTNGYAAAGDGGGWPLVYEVANTGTLQPWQIQTNGGTRRWQLKTDVVKVEMFGGKGDFSFTTNVGTDNYQALMNCINFVAVVTGSFNRGGPRIQFGYGFYYISQTVNVKSTVQIVGYATGQAGGYSTRLVFPADTMGFIFHRFDTIGSEIESPPTRGADGSLVKYLCIRSMGGTNRDMHGIWHRARVKTVDVAIESFPGNGQHIVASVTSNSPTRRGNTNNSEVLGGRITDCQNGIYLDGADANACYIAHADCSANRAWGLFDASFLGNTIVGCHFNGNGFAGQVSYGGNRYYLIGTTEQGAVTVPGTDSSVWVMSGPGNPGTTLFPLWVAGNTYYAGGSFGANSNNAQATFMGCYVEGGQPPAAVMFPSCVIGGINVSNRGTGAYLRSATWSNLNDIVSKHFAVELSGSADIEGVHIWNQTAGSGRYARMGFYAGFLDDGVTKRGVGRLSGRPVGSATTSPTEFGVDVWDGPTSAFVRALTFLSSGLVVRPDTDNAWTLGALLQRWKEVFATTLRVGPLGISITSGVGSPEGVVGAIKGSIYMRTDGAANETLYVKTTGTTTSSNTGWVLK